MEVEPKYAIRFFMETGMKWRKPLTGSINIMVEMSFSECMCITGFWR
jgi:hypothetical protein